MLLYTSAWMSNIFQNQNSCQVTYFTTPLLDVMSAEVWNFTNACSKPSKFLTTTVSGWNPSGTKEHKRSLRIKPLRTKYLLKNISNSKIQEFKGSETSQNSWNWISPSFSITSSHHQPSLCLEKPPEDWRYLYCWSLNFFNSKRLYAAQTITLTGLGNHGRIGPK